MTTENTANADWVEDDRRYFQHGSEANPPVSPFVLVRGKGSTVWDVDGREYLDAHAGAWLTQIGHGREEMAQVAAEQITQLEHFTTHAEYGSKPAIALARKLIELSPIKDGKVRYCCTGSEADDDALQVVRTYQERRGKPEKTVVLAFKGAYHGHTYGGLELGGHDRQSLDAGSIVQLTMPDPYDLTPFGGEDVTDFCIRELEETIARVGAENIAAMFGEPVFGPAGMFPPPADYWPRAVEVLRRNDILYVADEVVTGFGRTGKWFGCDLFDVRPDMMVLAKGLASGYAPIGAVIVSGEIATVMHGAHGGGSYAGHTLSCALALKNLEIIEQENLVQAAAERGAQMLAELTALEELPAVKTAHGAGLMLGLRLANREDGTPYVNTDGPVDTAIREQTGVIVMGNNQGLVITPPLVYTPDEVTQTTQALHKFFSQF